jgi:hypothetical protein
MQYQELGTKANHALYHAYLQSDHDYRVWAEVMTLEEKVVSTVALLDGQVNFASNQSEGPDRTASVILSDPEGALSFGMSFDEDDEGVLWVNRLIRLRHEVTVPTLGDVTTTCMVGLPTTVSRSEGEVSIELGDKSLLADHGVRPKTYKKGMNLRDALISILWDLTGERKLRIPTTNKTLSRPYTVGMGEDSLTPWRLAKRIAGKEMGWRLSYSSDGYATAESTATTHPEVDVEEILSMPEASASFTDFVNYVKVTSQRKVSTRTSTRSRDSRTRTLLYEGLAVLSKTDRLSEQSLQRNGVVRTLPLVISDDDLKSSAEVSTRALSELMSGASINTEQTYEIMPFFHLEQGHYLNLPMGIGKVGFKDASVPLGVEGNMSLGSVRWVSRPVKVKRPRVRTSVVRAKQRGGSQNG